MTPHLVIGEESGVQCIGDSITGLQVEAGCWCPVGDFTPGPQGVSGLGSACQ